MPDQSGHRTPPRRRQGNLRSDVAGVGELKAVAEELADAGAYALRRGRDWLRGLAQRARSEGDGNDARPSSRSRDEGFIPGSYGYGGEGRHASGGQPDGQADERHRGTGSDVDALARAYRAQGLPSQRGRGPRGWTRSDERILEDVSERLADDPMVDAVDIEVCCRQGRISLEGHVPVRWMKHRAEDLAEAVVGVRDVDNRIRVGARPADQDLGEAGAAQTQATGDAVTSTPAAAGTVRTGPVEPQSPH